MAEEDYETRLIILRFVFLLMFLFPIKNYTQFHHMKVNINSAFKSCAFRKERSPLTSNKQRITSTHRLEHDCQATAVLLLVSGNLRSQMFTFHWDILKIKISSCKLWGNNCSWTKRKCTIDFPVFIEIDSWMAREQSSLQNKKQMDLYVSFPQVSQHSWYLHSKTQ